MVRWFLLKNRRHQGPYSRDQLEKEQAEGRLQPWDFLISIESLDAGQLQYQPLYVVLDLPAPVVQAHHASSTPTIETVLPKLASHGEAPTQIPKSLDRPEKGRDVFEKTDSVDFVARHHAPEEETAVSGLSANRRVIETATQGTFNASSLWSGGGKKAVFFLATVTVAWGAWSYLAPEFSSKSPLHPDSSRAATATDRSAARSDVPPPNRHREEAVLRVPEAGEPRVDRPAAAPRHSRVERPMPEENSMSVPVDPASVPAPGADERFPRGAPAYTGDMPPETAEFPSNPRARMGRARDGGDDVELPVDGESPDKSLSEEGDESDGSEPGDY